MLNKFDHETGARTQYITQLCTRIMGQDPTNLPIMFKLYDIPKSLLPCKNLFLNENLKQCAQIF